MYKYTFFSAVDDISLYYIVSLIFRLGLLPEEIPFFLYLGNFSSASKVQLVLLFFFSCLSCCKNGSIHFLLFTPALLSCASNFLATLKLVMGYCKEPITLF